MIGNNESRMLPLTGRMLANMARIEAAPASISLILVQHLLHDTEEFIRLVRNVGFEVPKVVGIEYSAREDVVERLRSSGVDVIVPTLADSESVLQELFNTHIADSDSKRIIIQEVGGYYANLLGRLIQTPLKSEFLGVIEETKQGLWRYRALPAAPVPVVEIADSYLKRLEARYVGEAVGRAIETDLLETSSTLWGSRAVVLGFGDIGSAVAFSLRARGASVSCFDPDSLKLIDARIRGFRSANRLTLLSNADVLVGASGVRSLRDEELQQLPEGVMLASASSKDVEFPMDFILRHATNTLRLTSFVTEHTMPWGKRVRVASEGYPVNFRGFSLPHFMSDLLFAQIVTAMGRLLSKRISNGIHSLSKENQIGIAAEWLEVYQH